MMAVIDSNEGARLRVWRGAAVLDQQVPGWPERIDAGILDIDSGRRCIIGQLYGFYQTGAHVLGLESEAATLRGFVLRAQTYPARSVENRALVAAWRQLIAERLAVPARDLVFA